MEIHAPRGSQRSCKGWAQEAAMRMLMNNLDPEVAEHPDQLIVYGGSGRAARSWDAYAAIIATLQDLNDDETLLVQSGKPVGVLRTHEWAPRVLIANSNLVPQWATWEEFRRLEQLGLTMYGQMTAGSWIYIGTQGILQGTYETFAAVAAKRFGGSLAGTITLTAGLGGMGGAQPLAVTMNGGVAICVDCDQSRITRRIEHGYLDEQASRHRRRDPPGRRRAGQEPSPVHRPARQRRRRVPEPARQRRAHRHRHRPDLGPRSPELPAARRRVRGHGRAAGRGPGGLHQKSPRVDGRPRRRHGRLPRRRGGGLRLRQLDPRRGPARRLPAGVRLPRLRPRLHQAAVLRGQGPVPLGGAVRRPEGHRGHRPGHPRPVPAERGAGQVDQAGPGEGALPGAARPGSAGSATASGTWPACASTSWSTAATCPPRWCSAATTWTAARSPRRTGRPRRWPTAPTPSPTGRC